VTALCIAGLSGKSVAAVIVSSAAILLAAITISAPTSIDSLLCLVSTVELLLTTYSPVSESSLAKEISSWL